MSFSLQSAAGLQAVTVRGIVAPVGERPMNKIVLPVLLLGIAASVKAPARPREEGASEAGPRFAVPQTRPREAAEEQPPRGVPQQDPRQMPQPQSQPAPRQMPSP